MGRPEQTHALFRPHTVSWAGGRGSGPAHRVRTGPGHSRRRGHACQGHGHYPSGGCLHPCQGPAAAGALSSVAQRVSPGLAIHAPRGHWTQSLPDSGTGSPGGLVCALHSWEKAHLAGCALRPGWAPSARPAGSPAGAPLLPPTVGRGEVCKTQRAQQGTCLMPRTHPGGRHPSNTLGRLVGPQEAASTRPASSLEGCPAPEAPCAHVRVHLSASLSAHAHEPVCTCLGPCKGTQHPTCGRPRSQPQILNSQPP